MSEGNSELLKTALEKAATPALPVRNYSAENAMELGLPSPEALNMLDAFAKRMQGSVFIPKALQGHPANMLGVVLRGREMGFSPMMSLALFWVSPDGRLAMYADAMMANMRAHGFKFPEKEFTNERGFLKAVRPDGEAYESEFTIKDAATAGLMKKDNYIHYPKAMLKARVIADVFRFLAADLGGAQIYAREEIEDVEMPKGEGYAEGAPELPIEQFAIGVKPGPGAQPPAEQPPEPRQPPVEAAATPQTGSTTVVSGASAQAATLPEQVPAGPTGAPLAPAPAEQPKSDLETMKARLTALIPKIGANAKAAQGMINSFFGGFLGVDKLPKATGPLVAKYMAAIDKLETRLTSDPAGFLANAKLAGQQAAGTAPVADKGAPPKALFDKLNWPDWVRDRAIALQNQWGSSTSEFEDFIGFSGIERLLVDDAGAILGVYLRTRSASRILKFADQHKKQITLLVAAVEQALNKDIEHAEVRDIEAAIVKLGEVLEAEHKETGGDLDDLLFDNKK